MTEIPMIGVRPSPWLERSEQLPEVKSSREAIKIAGLDWKVDKAPFRYDLERADKSKVTLEYPRKYVIARTDTGVALGIVGEQYKPLQNIEAFRFMDEVLRIPEGPKVVAAGSTRGGLRVWILCELQNVWQVDKNDWIKEYLLLSNTHDGSQCVNVVWTPYRIQCANILSLAIKEADPKKRLRFKHVGDFKSRIVRGRDVLGIASENSKTLHEALNVMKSIEPTDVECRQLLKAVIKPPSGRAEQTLQTTQVHNTIMELFRDGAANISAGDTKTLYAFYQAGTEYYDHFKPVRPHVLEDATEERIMSNWWGKSAIAKETFFNAVMTLVK